MIFTFELLFVCTFIVILCVYHVQNNKLLLTDWLEKLLPRVVKCVHTKVGSGAIDRCVKDGSLMRVDIWQFIDGPQQHLWDADVIAWRHRRQSTWRTLITLHYTATSLSTTNSCCGAACINSTTGRPHCSQHNKRHWNSGLHQTCHHGRVPGDVVTYCFFLRNPKYFYPTNRKWN